MQVALLSPLITNFFFASVGLAFSTSMFTLEDTRCRIASIQHSDDDPLHHTTCLGYPRAQRPCRINIRHSVLRKTANFNQREPQMRAMRNQVQWTTILYRACRRSVRHPCQQGERAAKKHHVYEDEGKGFRVASTYRVRSTCTVVPGDPIHADVAWHLINVITNDHQNPTAFMRRATSRKSREFKNRT